MAALSEYDDGFRAFCLRSVIGVTKARRNSPRAFVWLAYDLSIGKLGSIRFQNSPESVERCSFTVAKYDSNRADRMRRTALVSSIVMGKDLACFAQTATEAVGQPSGAPIVPPIRGVA